MTRLQLKVFVQVELDPHQLENETVEHLVWLDRQRLVAR